MSINVKQGVLFADPKTDGERGDVASACVRKLGIEVPALVDDIANSVEMAYTAWPDRLFLIDREGKVAYKSKPGPFGFKPADAERVLQALLSEGR